MAKKKKTLREENEKKFLMDNDFYLHIESIIKEQKYTSGRNPKKEVTEAIMEKWGDSFVISLTTVKRLVSCMRKYGHINWVEEVLDERVKNQFGESFTGKSYSGPREPVNGDQKEYAVNIDTNGRRFVRIPVSLLKMERGQKVTAMFHQDEIVIKAKRRIL